MAWVDRWFRIFLVLLGVGLAALVVKQGIAIAEYGVGGWLRGDGPSQTEWEVRAVIGLVFIGLPAVLLVGLVRRGEGVLTHLRDWRLARAIRRSQKPPKA